MFNVYFPKQGRFEYETLAKHCTKILVFNKIIFVFSIGKSGYKRSYFNSLFQKKVLTVKVTRTFADTYYNV
jgi:hypothetical protein